MNFDDDRDSRRRRKPDPETASAAPSRPRKRRRPPVNEFGDALRSAYTRTLDEDIPPEMLDLLGKLS